ncbi:MAG: DUF421 domain-containing protein, partial [Chitinophagales bacterium]
VFYQNAATELSFVMAIVSIVFFIRIFGKKELSQLSITDLVFILLISNAVQNAMVNGDWQSFFMGIVAASTLFILNSILKMITYRNPHLRRWIFGQPTVLIEDGKMYSDNLTKEKISEDELMAAIREHGVDKIEDVKLAMLENDGSISVVSFDSDSKTIVRRRARKIPARTRQQS